MDRLYQSLSCFFGNVEAILKYRDQSSNFQSSLVVWDSQGLMLASFIAAKALVRMGLV